MPLEPAADLPAVPVHLAMTAVFGVAGAGLLSYAAARAEVPGAAVVSGLAAAAMIGVLMWWVSRRWLSRGLDDLARVPPPAPGAARRAVRRGVLGSGLIVVAEVLFITVLEATGVEEVGPVIAGLVLGAGVWTALGAADEARRAKRDGLAVHTRLGAATWSLRNRQLTDQLVLVETR